MKTITVTNKGKRSVNEDFVLSQSLNSEQYLNIIADGMGGYEKGEEASRIITEKISSHLSKLPNINDEDVQFAIDDANMAISQFKEQLKIKLGATIGGVIIKNNCAKCFWVGDVKIYHFHDKRLSFESDPHSLMAELINNGNIVDIEKIAKYKHIVTRSIHGDLGKSEAAFIDIKTIGKEDVFIICSDGVHDIINGLQMEYLFNEKGEIESVVQEIEEHCKLNAKDNYSFIVIADI
ncbi:MAG: protein phosphatase 2C domain-containing protein [Bacteroidia bacterium]|nr:protein phosphatase 2C domain-containing protein [Bacteroidia bacterium]